MHNFEADRWPCGNPETGYKDTDGSPTKTFALNQGKGSIAFEKCFGKRLQEELYDLEKDPECMNNLATDERYGETLRGMKKELFEELKIQGDPRMLGKGDVFDNYVHSKKPRYYEKFMKSKNKK